MYRSSWFLTAALVGTNVALVQQVAGAKSAVEVGRIAKAITVEIKTIGSTESRIRDFVTAARKCICGVDGWACGEKK
jgi:hypothetical protein